MPILRTRYQGEDHLVALAGESQWVRTVRAARGEAVIRRRGGRHVHLTELAPADRADIIAEYLHAARRRSGAAANAAQMRFYFGLDPDASIEDIRAIVDYYPVFRVRYAGRAHHRAQPARDSGRIGGTTTIARPVAEVFDFVADSGRAEVQPPDDRGREADPRAHHHRNAVVGHLRVAAAAT